MSDPAHPDTEEGQPTSHNSDHPPPPATASNMPSATPPTREDSLTPAPPAPAEDTSTPTAASANPEAPHTSTNTDPMIDPSLASLPAPPPTDTNGERGPLMSITESIRNAPVPRTTDFSMLPLNEDGLDVAALEQAQADDGIPGSPTSKAMRAMAPPNAMQPNPNWPSPPPNSSVNLFIGRALLSNGNDNWPLKPNDIVNWIRKHYPSEWDGDEGRCSAHRVRTYLARKGADMYYEKLNQGCIAGWRIRANHLWRFENGGFQGRGMKQEEAIAAQQKEAEMAAAETHKLAAQQALQAGHPNVKVGLSLPGVNDGSAPPIKRQRVRASMSAAQQRRRSTKKEDGGDLSVGLGLGNGTDSSSFYSHPVYTPSHHYAPAQPSHQSQVGEPSTSQHVGASGLQIDPSLMSAAQAAEEQGNVDHTILQQAMQAAAAAANAGQMDELEMELPIEMQGMHHGDHDDPDGGRYGVYGGSGAGGGRAPAEEAGSQGQQHPYTPHEAGFGSTGVYGAAAYQGGQ